MKKNIKGAKTDAVDTRRETRVLLEDIRQQVHVVAEGHGAIMRKLNEHGRKLDEHGYKLDEHSMKFRQIDQRFDRIEMVLTDTNDRVGRIEIALADTNGRVARIETALAETNDCVRKIAKDFDSRIVRLEGGKHAS